MTNNKKIEKLEKQLNKISEELESLKKEEQVENKVRATRLEAAIARRRKELNGDWVPDWRGAQNNYHIYLRYWGPEGETLAFGFYKSRDDARTIIEEFEEKLLWYFKEYLPSIN